MHAARIIAVLALLGIASAQAAEKVTYLLPAPPFLVAFAPWMLAKHMGYYAQEGLEVDFQAARGGADVAKQVGAGNAVIGGGIGDTPLIVRVNDIPIKAVAILGGGSLFTFSYHRDKGITGPKDLKGKTLTVFTYQDTTYYAALGMLATVGLTKNDVSIQAAGATNMWKLFAAGQADAMVSSPDLTVNVAMEEGAAKDVVVVPMDTYYKSTAQSIVASDQVIREKPELIAKLVRATLRGMKDIMNDPKAAAAEYVKAVPQQANNAKSVEESLVLYNKYVYPGQPKLGWIDEERLAGLQKFYLDQGIIDKALPIKDHFTNQFIE